jgi:glutathione peroxidase-family protein
MAVHGVKARKLGGAVVSLAQYKGKVLLVENVASL